MGWAGKGLTLVLAFASGLIQDLALIALYQQAGKPAHVCVGVGLSPPCWGQKSQNTQ